MSIGEWFGKQKTEQEREAERHFRRAMLLLKNLDEPEALALFRRVLQLTPGDEEAIAWRKKLSEELGIEKLEETAQVLERFAYSHCGPGDRWAVDVREMYAFRPHQEPLTYEAVLLDLRQQPPAFIEVTLRQDGYKLRLMGNRPVDGVDRTCLREIMAETVPAGVDSLKNALDGLVKGGLLVKRERQLAYVPTPGG